jgi:hypothetical protein
VRFSASKSFSGWWRFRRQGGYLAVVVIELLLIKYEDHRWLAQETQVDTPTHYVKHKQKVFCVREQ